jgi:hypothetical protein
MVGQQDFISNIAPRTMDKAGVDEPGGLEGAEYTHRGRESKILTSLIAPDAVVEIALRKGSRVLKVVELFEGMASWHAGIELKVATAPLPTH